ncbi:phosphoglycerate kinase [Bacillus cereus]
MRDISRRLEEYINKEIKFLSYDINDWRLKEEIEMMNDGDVVYLENIRRFKDELENTNSFSRELAQLGEIYINDAFSAFHRKHSSTYGLATLLESEIGHTAKAEIETLNRIKLNSDKPLVTIIGGEKIVEKLNAMEGLLNESDVILTGGIIATIFLQVLNYPISHSFSSTLLEQAKKNP